MVSGSHKFYVLPSVAELIFNVKFNVNVCIGFSYTNQQKRDYMVKPLKKRIQPLYHHVFARYCPKKPVFYLLTTTTQWATESYK